MDSARAFAAKFGIQHAYGNYEELVQDKNVEVVYIGSPHPSHFENIMMCLKHGTIPLELSYLSDLPYDHRQARLVREALDPQLERSYSMRRTRSQTKVVHDGGHVDSLLPRCAEG